MTLRHMKIFTMVCETGNMTEAATKLSISQPAVSQAIKELEEYYRVVLFERMSKQLFITEAGIELKSYALHIVSLFDEAEKKLHDTESKKNIRIGANVTVGTTLIQGYIKKYNEQYPYVNVKVIVNNSVMIERMLNNNELDFALMEETTRKTYFNTESFYDDKIAVITYVENRLNQMEEVTFEDVVKEKLLLREKGAGVRDTFEHLAYLRGITIEPLWESCSTTALVNAVKEKMGVAIVPYQVVKEDIDKKEVFEINVSDVSLARRLTIVTHKKKYISKEVENFINIVRQFYD